MSDACRMHRTYENGYRKENVWNNSIKMGSIDMM